MSERATPLRVLVVDDELLIRWSIAETLRSGSCEVVEAATAAEALQDVSDGPPFDVVLLDFRLPDSNDLSLLENIRRLSPTSAVAMMTAYGTQAMQSAAMELGARLVLSKPFDMRAIGELVNELGQRHA
jgi:two-component system nitrogen regulation response regulator GlnG